MSATGYLLVGSVIAVVLLVIWLVVFVVETRWPHSKL